MRSDTSVRPFQKIKLEDIRIGDEISMSVDSNVIFSNSTILQIFKCLDCGILVSYDIYIIKDYSKYMFTVNSEQFKEVSVYKHYDRNHDFENEKTETEKHSDFYKQLKTFALKQNSAVVKIYYKSPLCGKDYSIKDVKITRGIIENLNATSIYIKNENSVIEVFRFADIVQMIEI